MTASGGIGGSEAPGISPQHSEKQEDIQQKRTDALSHEDEIKEQVEATPEAKEAAEAEQQLDDATLTPAEKVQGSEDYKGSEAVEEAFTAAMSAAADASLDGKGADLQAVSTDGESDPVLDIGQDTVEQAGDLKQPVRDGGGPGDGMVDANRTEAAGQMGDVIPEGIDLPEGTGVPDLMDGPGGKDPGELGGPDIGLDRDGQLGDLRNAAQFGGGDSRVGWTGEQSWSDSMSSDGSQSIQGNESYTMDDGTTQTISTTHENGTTTQTVTTTSPDGTTNTTTSTTNADGTTTTTESTTSGDGSDGTSSEGTSGESTPKPADDTGQQSYDPDGSTGSTPTGDDAIEAALRESGMPKVEREPMDYVESMSQPTGEGTNGEKPRENLEEQMAGSDVDPYAQYTGEEQETPDVIPDKELEDERVPIDPPEIVGGGEGIQGSLAALESKVEAADSAKTDQAAAVLQEQALAGKGETDLQALTANVVKAQYEKLSDSDNEIMQAVVAEKAASALDEAVAALEDKLGAIGDDDQLANIDLQNMLQKQQQTIQMMSNISKVLHDTALAVIRKIG